MLHGAGHASSPFAVAVANAAVKCPDGFSSVSAHGLPAGSDPTATLSDKCALDFGIPAGTKGDKGDKGDTGAQGIAGPPGVSGFGPAYATTVKSSKSNSSERARATAKCPAGKKAVSGGYAITATIGGVLAPQTAAVSSIMLNSSRSNVNINQPTPDGNGWTVEAATTVKGSKPNTSERARVALKVTVDCAVMP